MRWICLIVGLLLAPATAVAQGCADPQHHVAQAWLVFRQAEHDRALEHLSQAEAALPCQRTVVQPSTLLELHWLRALVALAADDTSHTSSALRAAIAVEHGPSGRPPLQYGPELAGLWDELAGEAAARLITIRVEGADPAWVDGRRIDPGGELLAAPGAHVVQVPVGEELSTQVVRMEVDQTVATEALPPLVAVRPPPRRRPPTLFVATAVAGAASAWGIATGVVSERSFQASDYRAVSYDFCRIDQACYPEARSTAIQTDASRINRAYGFGYGMAALTSGLLTVTFVGLPPRRQDAP